MKRSSGVIVGLQSGIVAVTYGLMRLSGLPLPAVHLPPLSALVMTLVFLFAAVCEELGWTGYALDPMQQRWTAFGACP